MRRLTPAQVRLLILVVTTLLACWAALAAIDADRVTQGSTPAPTPTTATVRMPDPTTSTSTSSTTTTSTTTTLVPAEMTAALRCPEWAAVNAAAGFPIDELPTADRIVWAESRCRLEAVNAADPNGGSWCAWQINRIHEGHLVADGIIGRWEDLTSSPAACAAAAFTVYTRARGFTPWATY
jgi:cytoskeletal protein RodZ